MATIWLPYKIFGANFMSIYLVGEIWYYDIKLKGRPRLRASTETSDEDKAQEKHDRIKAQLWDEKHLGRRPALAYSFKDAAREWLTLAPRGDEDKYRLRWILSEWAGKVLGEIDEECIYKLLAIKRAEGVKPSTINRYINLIIAVLNVARRRKWMSDTPEVVRAEVTKGRVRWLTADEWIALEPELPQHLRQMARFTLACGLRENNVIWLKWEQIDMARRVAWVYPDEMKQGEAHGYPLNDDAITVLTEQLGLHETWVFPYNGSPVTRTSNHAWRKAKARAGVKNFRWHDLRHTWASWHVMNGTRLEELQKLGGWATLEQVQIYAHLSSGHLAGVAGNVKPVSNVTVVPQGIVVVASRSRKSLNS